MTDQQRQTLMRRAIQLSVENVQRGGGPFGAVIVKDGKAAGLTCEYTQELNGKLSGTGETFDLPADMIFRAIGQTYVDATGGKLALERSAFRTVADE